MSDSVLSRDTAAGARHYTHTGFAVLRTPLLPIDALFPSDASAGCHLPTEGDDLAVYAAERQPAVDHLFAAFAQPALREALFIASPALYEALGKWEDGCGSHPDERLVLALARYFARAAYRATPFGLFAGCSALPIAPVSRLELGAATTYRRRSRLDMDYVAELAEECAASPDVRRAVPLVPNSTTHVMVGRLHYVRSEMVKRERRYALESVEVSPTLEATLARASAGAAFGALAAALVDDEVELADAERFIEELLDRQLLVPQVHPCITSDEGDALPTLLRDISTIESRRSGVEALARAQECLTDIDERGVGTAPGSYSACVAALDELPVKPTAGRTVQVDLYKPAPTAVLGVAIAEEAARAASLFYGLSSGADPLVDFAERFAERYEEREVPLLEVLDDEIGIGFLGSGRPTAAAMASLETARRRDAILAEVRDRAARSNSRAVELTEAEVRRMSVRPAGPPADSIAFFGSVLHPESDDADPSEFRLFVASIGGPSGALLLGRFSHLDEALRTCVKSVIDAEERARPGVIFAEVVHLPQGRIGNILSRPLLRPYEIPYLGRSGVDAEHQIHVSDLMMSVTRGRIALRSARLDREVVPRLTSAHHHRHASNLPVYRFLCALQQHAVAQVTAWHWGCHDAVAAFLPRVTYGRLVLARARWRLSEAEIGSLRAVSASRRRSLMRKLRAERGIPQLVVLADGDNHLPLDLEERLHLDVLVDQLAESKAALLLEMLALPGKPCVRGPEGRFINEVIIPLARVGETAADTRVARVRSPLRSRRHFVPGSGWMFAKLYAGPGLGDRIIVEHLAPFANECLRAGSIEGWFYVRYYDTQWHLRIRFLGSPDSLNTAVLPGLAAIADSLIERGVVSRMQQDTYSRELERYGGDAGMELAERLFFADTECAVALIRDEVSGHAADANDARLVSAISAVGAIFDSLEMPIERRRDLLDAMSRAPSGTRKVWGEWYRRQRAPLSGAMEPGATASPSSWRARALREKRERMSPIVGTLRECERRGELGRPIDELVQSYAHMCINRTLRPGQRDMELMCYDALGRYYRSVMARGLASGGDA